jgi:hypothetical protein
MVTLLFRQLLGTATWTVAVRSPRAALPSGMPLPRRRAWFPSVSRRQPAISGAVSIGTRRFAAERGREVDRHLANRLTPSRRKKS